MVKLQFDEPEKYTRVFAADVANTDKVLQFVEEDMLRHSLSPQSVYNMVVATEEIFSNIAQYAYTKDGTVSITTYIKDGFYHIQYVDCGKIYDPLLKPDPDITEAAETRNVGGLGIFLVKKMTDKVTYERQNGQNVLTIGIKVS